MITSSLEYSYFPIQRILAQHPNSSKPALFDITFKFRSIGGQDSKNEVIIGGSRLCGNLHWINIDGDEIMNKLNFGLMIQHDLKMNQLSCMINGSLDLFDRKTVDKILQRFYSMLHQLFISKGDQIKKPIYELSLILPDEGILMKSTNNTEVSTPSVCCIHYDFVCQVMKHPQKLAVELDDQCLTYAELLFCVQLLAIHLLNQYGIVPGEIISQCVDRSLSMVS
jgi:non-ribosomal peptide synthetase component F